MSVEYASKSVEYASKQDLQQVLSAVNQLTEVVTAGQKEKSEKAIIIEAMNEELSTLDDDYAEQREAIVAKYEPKLKELARENERKFHRSISSGGKVVGSFLGKITKPARALKEGIASEL